MTTELLDPPPTTSGDSRTARNKAFRPIDKDELFTEAQAIAMAPLGPVCDTRALLSAPLATSSMTAPLVRAEDASGHQGWIYRYADGEIISPLAPPGRSPLVDTSKVLDVYVGLLIELERADYPADGRVRFGRQEFLKRIQRTGKSGRPSGANYADLDAAILYLSEMRVRTSAIERFESVEMGAEVDGELTFHILQAHGRVSQLQLLGLDESNRDDAGHRADDIVVYFSTPFVRLARDAAPRVSYRLSHYLAFKPGAARAFYRWVAQLSLRKLTEGAITVDLDEVFAAVGSTARGAPPAKLRGLIHDAPEVLETLGVLRDELKFTRVHTADGVIHRVTLWPATPPTDDLKELLRRTLVDWGVNPPMAKKYAEEHPGWTATVVAAVMQGMIEIGQSLPAMLVDYLKDPNRSLRAHEMPRFEPMLPGQRLTSLEGNRGMRYLQSEFMRARAYLGNLASKQRADLQTEFSSAGRPAWVVEGLMLVHVRRWGAWQSLSDYLRHNPAP